jgi:hypothetical protein
LPPRTTPFAAAEGRAAVSAVIVRLICGHGRPQRSTVQHLPTHPGACVIMGTFQFTTRKHSPEP